MIIKERHEENWKEAELKKKKKVIEETAEKS